MKKSVIFFCFGSDVEITTPQPTVLTLNSLSISDTPLILPPARIKSSIIIALVSGRTARFESDIF